ncbi:MAG TPA: hypothetical protein VFG42_23190, partial [Baekduia sp.]|uniref:hypothetical protein n=1 Tax=Baekduia sp. TaxID=2600305 RepID=UPI002D771786
MTAHTNQSAIALTEEKTMTWMSRATRGGIAAACLALLAALLLLLLAGSARAADWGLEPGSFHVDLSTTQAGGHPDVRTAFRFEQGPGDFGGMPTDVPNENVRDIKVELPPGLIGNPQAYPTCKPIEFPVCPADTQVGTVTLSLVFYGDVQTPVYNMEPAQGTIAQFGFSALIIPIHLTASLRPDDHGLTLDIPQTPQVIPLLGVDMMFWGTPGSPAHDTERTALCYLGGCQSTTDPFNPFPAAGFKSGVGLRPFMNNGSQCGVATSAKFTMNSWTHVDEFRTFDTDIPALTGCDKEKFTPTVSVRPGSSEAGAPTGLGVDIDIPQTTDASANATPPLKRAVVTLPEGMTLSPSAADGLVGCADAQLGLEDNDPATCPRASEIGTASIKTPLLADDMTGRIYLGTPTADQLVRLFLVVEGGNVRLKMVGRVDTDPATGRVTTTFDDLPPLASSRISLNFTGGPRAVLSNPVACGTSSASVALTPWSSDDATARTSPITVDQACDKGGAFTPSVTAGNASSVAGASSPFTLSVSKPDGQPNIQSLDVALPQGLLARLSDVPLCAEAQAAAGTCGADSQIGHTTVSVGPGANPVTLPQAGKAPTAVYLGGPYKGAPFSLSIVVPAQAGPYDLGTVVVRAALFVDANKAQVTIKSDPLPQILKGFPLQYRTINVTVDRPGFMINPTSCAPTSVGTTVASAAGQAAPVLTRYQVGECASTPLAPKLTLGLSGRSELKDGGHPALVAGLTQQSGESGLRNVKVTLPLSMSLDPDNAQALCKPEQAAAKACPEGSIVGQATVRTPALHEALTGPVYFVEATRTTTTGKVRKTFPNLWLKLEGEGVSLDLWASSTVDDAGHLVTTFDDIPDAPVTSFQLDLAGGAHGILVGNENICAAQDDSVAAFTGQTGKVVKSKGLMSLADCSLSVAKTTTSSRSITLRLAGLGAGKVKLSGSGVTAVSRTIASAHGASLTARLTA